MSDAAPASAPVRRGAIDPRLLEYARSTRSFITLSIALGTTTALLIIAQAWLLAGIIAAVFDHGAGVTRERLPLALLLGVTLGRAAVAWAAELAANRSSARAKSQLRAGLLEHVAALGPSHFGAERRGEIAVLATRGVDALDGYFSLYLPQLVLAVIVPIAVIITVLDRDWISAAIIALTIPLIPLFMALVGATTRERMDGQVRALQQLAGHFLDVVSGLPTLKVFGRAKAQIRAVGQVTDDYRRAAMSTLAVTFLSSLILELVATISVALVAVAVGLRLMSGHLDLRSALLALILAPEAYLPLRRLGANYHASAEGVAAAQQVFAVLEMPLPARGRDAEVPNPAVSGLSVEGLTVRYPDRPSPALNGVSLTVEPGEILALTGPSGCGKSTLLHLLGGLDRPSAGELWLNGRRIDRLSERELARLRRHEVGFVFQAFHLMDELTAQENVELPALLAGRTPREARNRARQLLDQVGLGDRAGHLPSALSGGQRQRVAIARALANEPLLLLADEPTGNLDSAATLEVLRLFESLHADGFTLVVVTHDERIAATADRLISMRDGVLVDETRLTGGTSGKLADLAGLGG